MRLCGDGYFIDVAADEAAAVAGNNLLLRTEAYVLGVHSERVPRAAAAVVEAVEVPGLGHAERHDMREFPGFRRVAWVYRLTLEGPIDVSSNWFTASEADFAMLSRIRRVTAGECARPSWEDPEFDARPHPDALQWSPASRRGPAFHCQNGIGFPVGEEETLRRPWRTEPSYGLTSRLDTPRGQLSIEGPLQSWTPAGERRLIDYPNRAELFHSETTEYGGLWSMPIVPPGTNFRDLIQRQVIVRFSGDDPGELLAFVRRVEPVAAGDSRCASDG